MDWFLSLFCSSTNDFAETGPNSSSAQSTTPMDAQAFALSTIDPNCPCIVHIAYHSVRNGIGYRHFIVCELSPTETRPKIEWIGNAFGHWSEFACDKKFIAGYCKGIRGKFSFGQMQSAVRKASHGAKYSRTTAYNCNNWTKDVCRKLGMPVHIDE